MTVIPKKTQSKHFFIGVLLYMGNFMVFTFLVLMMTSSIISLEISAQEINTLISTYFGLLIFGVIFWAPLGIVTGYFYMTSGFKSALRFILFSDIGLVAVLLMFKGSCQPETNFGLLILPY